MHKKVILDTNVILDEPQVLTKLKNVEILVPVIIIKELDKFKSGYGIIHRNSREATRILEQYRIGKIKSKLRKVTFIPKSKYPNSDYADDAIIELAKNTGAKIISNDLNVRVAAFCDGIKSEPYLLKGKNQEKKKEYKGYSILKTDPERYAKEIKSFSARPNHYFVTEDKNNPKRSKVYRRKSGNMTIIKNDVYNNIEGISALNFQQKMAMDAILDDNISLVSLVGSAGTGKTLIALACGISLVREQRYNSVSVGRSIIPLGKDMGALPGDAEEKVRPFLSPIYDNLDVIAQAKNDDFNLSYTKELEEEKKLSIQPLAFLRGRSLKNQFFIIDEAQNLSLHEMSTIITRAGEGSKIILLGDPNQIDTPGLDKYNNGLTFITDTFVGQKCFANITLDRVERSELAELAVNLLKI